MGCASLIGSDDYAIQIPVSHHCDLFGRLFTANRHANPYNRSNDRPNPTARNGYSSSDPHAGGAAG